MNGSPSAIPSDVRTDQAAANSSRWAAHTSSEKSEVCVMKSESPGEIQSPMRAIRKRFGMNQRQFGLALGCSAAHISEIETGVAQLSGKDIQALEAVHMAASEIAAMQTAFVENCRRALLAALEGGMPDGIPDP